MSITGDIRNTLAIYCDDHIDVDKIEDECFISMQDCEYHPTITTDEEIHKILDEIREFDVTIISVDVIEKRYGFDIEICAKMSTWLAYQDEILKKHERYIRRRRGLPVGPRPDKKNHHRIVKSGFSRNGKQRYIIINPDGKRVKCSVDKNKLEKQLKIIRNQALKEELKYWPFTTLIKRE